MRIVAALFVAMHGIGHIIWFFGTSCPEGTPGHQHKACTRRPCLTSPGGDPLRSSNFRRRVWLPAVESLEGRVPLGLTPHHLRQTCASLLIRSGAHAKAIQAHLGHSSITVTMDVYGHLFEDDMDELAQRLDVAHREAKALASTNNVRTLKRG